MDPAAGVLAALAQRPKLARGRIVMTISAREQEGADELARSIALSSSREGPEQDLRILLELDVARNQQFEYFADLALHEETSRLGPPLDARLNGESFYRVVDAAGRVRRAADAALTFHRVGQTRLFVSAFNAGAVGAAGRVGITAGDRYWRQMRRFCDLCVVEAPPLDRCAIALAVAPFVDGVVIAVSARAGAVSASVRLKGELEAVRAPLLGVVYTHADRLTSALERAIGR
jgi:hypothetical protein